MASAIFRADAVGRPAATPVTAPSRRALLASLIVAVPLAACGFAPLHGPARDGPAIAIDPIDGAAGFALRERLVERLGAPAAPDYRLTVALDLREESAAITRDNVTTRFVLLGSARYTLAAIGGGEPLVTEALTARTAYSAPAAETATVFAARSAALAAEERLARTLADRIALRLALLAL